MVDPVLRRALVRAAGKVLEEGMGKALTAVQVASGGRVSRADALSILAEAFQGALRNVDTKVQVGPKPR